MVRYYYIGQINYDDEQAAGLLAIDLLGRGTCTGESS